LIRRSERMDHVSMRTEKVIGRGADGWIIVNNRNHRKR
jgi:hypothetical protein